MIDEFVTKYENLEYISNYLYSRVKEQCIEVIPEGFNLDEYNNYILKKQYSKYKEYFDTMYNGIDDNIHLDEEQVKAILADEDYSLIIAGAGTGKTTTMASKVKYLVDIKDVDPEKIVVMSFTKKTTMELYNRIVLDFGINANVLTFHSLGMNYIKELFGSQKVCYIVDDFKRRDIFLSYFKEKLFGNKEKIQEIAEIFSRDNTKIDWMFSKHFIQNYEQFVSFDDYFEYYKEYKYRSNLEIQKIIDSKIEHDLNAEVIHTINNEIVKSKGEAIIANFLFCNGINYEYEKVYEEIMPDNNSYKPDFTLYLNGEKVYIEYFGLYDPENESSRYNKNRKLKEQFHENKSNKFISLDYMPDKDLVNVLKEKLTEYGFVMMPKSKKAIYFALLDRNPVSELYPYMNFLYENIDMIKSQQNRDNVKDVAAKYLETVNDEEAKALAFKQFSYIYDFYKYYQAKLYDDVNYGFDFQDMIYYANKYIDKISSSDYKFNYEYLIIDEYQDISQERYELTKKIADKNRAKILAVGDDWQSIYAFSGSKIEYIYNFQKYFPYAKLLRITRTYRNSQELVKYAGTFIMQNKNQIEKELVSTKEEERPVEFIGFEDGDEYEVLKRLILHIHENNPDHHILVLARNNKMINNCFNNGLKDDIGTKVTFVGNESIDIDAMTIHKSKGLTSDEVIIIGLDNSFPHEEYTKFWLEGLFKNHMEPEAIEFAEERRIFYVGLTRTKNKVYLLVNKDKEKRSPFISEISRIINEENEKAN